MIHGTDGRDPQFGYGLVQVSGAVPPATEVPVVSIAGPIDGTTFLVGNSIPFAGSASDSNDGDLTGQLTWTSSVDGQIGMGGSFSRGLSVGQYTITATVVDREGNPDGESVRVTVTTTAKAPGPVRVNSGEGRYVGSNRVVWSADTAYWLGATYSTTAPIANTTHDPLYRTERYGSFSYHFAVPPGTYQVTLEFAEIYHTSRGQRLFDVSIEGKVVLDDFDILAHTKPNTTLDRTFTTTVSADGILNVDLSTVKDNAKISAIEVIRKK